MVVLPHRTKNDSWVANIFDLPLELHFRIRNLLLTDPDIPPSQLRTLRLVCKSFDFIYAPAALSHLVLFRSKLLGPPYLTLVETLRYFVHERHSSSTYYTSLTIKHWNCTDIPLDRRSSLIPKHSRKTPIDALVHRLWNNGPTPIALVLLLATGGIALLVVLFIYIRIGAIVFLSIIVAYFLILFILVTLRRGYLILPWRGILLKNGKTLLNVLRLFQARFYMALLPRKLDLSNVRRVRFYIDSYSSNWSVRRSTKLLLSLPQLTELELFISHDTDLKYTTECLAPLNKLHKLSLLNSTAISPSHTCCLSTLIAQNDSLTHFDYDWRPDIPYDLSLLFHGVPMFKPLRLQYLSLNTTCTNFEAIIPHARSLISFEFNYGNNTWCDAFSKANVFPTTIKVERLDAVLAEFIRKHAGIVSLTISTDTPEEIPLFNALYRHQKTLHHLCLPAKFAARVLCNVDVELDFLQCAEGLRELVLLNDEKASSGANTDTSDTSYAHYESKIFPIIATLDRALTVVISSQNKEIFTSCYEFCRTSSNPFIRDLARRLVYEK